VLLRALRNPVRVGVAGKQSGLEEDQAGKPYGSGSAEDGEKLLGRDGLNEEEQKCGQEDRRASKISVRQCGKRLLESMSDPPRELSSEARRCQIRK
jgi:hypothetical protein